MKRKPKQKKKAGVATKRRIVYATQESVLVLEEHIRSLEKRLGETNERLRVISDVRRSVDELMARVECAHRITQAVGSLRRDIDAMKTLCEEPIKPLEISSGKATFRCHATRLGTMIRGLILYGHKVGGIRVQAMGDLLECEAAVGEQELPIVNT